MSAESYRCSPDEVKKFIKDFLASDNPENQDVDRGDPLWDSRRIRFKYNGIIQTLRVVFFNAPALLADVADLASAQVRRSHKISVDHREGEKGQEKKGHKKESGEPDLMKQLLGDGVRGGNLVEALANMMFYAYELARNYDFEAEKDTEKAGKLLEQLSKDVQKLLESDDVKPLVKTVREVFNKIGGSPISEETAKLIVQAFIVKESAAKARINWAKMAGVGSIACLAGAAILGFLLPFPFNLVAAGLILAGGLVLGATGLYLKGSSDKLVMSHIEMMRFGNYCKMLSDLKDLLLNRPDYVGRKNVLVLVYDDMYDLDEMLEAKPWYRFKATVADSYHNKGAFCDFATVVTTDDIAPKMKDYRNRNNLNAIDFLTRAVQELTGSEDKQEPMTDGSEEKGETTKMSD